MIRVFVDPDIEKQITTLTDAYNYFYSDIGYPSSDYLYFYFYDKYKEIIGETIYYCMTSYNPEFYTTPCSSFKSLSYYDKNINVHYAYSFTVDTSSNRGGYVIVRYSAKNNGLLFVKCSYIALSSPLSLSTVAIVFIVIGSVTFVGTIIFLIIYCRKKRVSRNLANLTTQPAEALSPPSHPLME